MSYNIRQMLRLVRLPLTCHISLLRPISSLSTTSNRKRHYHNSKLKYLGIVGVVGGLSLYLSSADAKIDENPDSNKIPLRVIKHDEVKKHSSMQNGIWVTYQGNVYDITNFVEQHPGGKKILLAAGGAIEPFWQLYGVHNTKEVHELLEEFKIGILSKEDKAVSVTNHDDPYMNDPVRHPVLKPASVKPYNAEPPPALLIDKFDTPNDIFYVRNHLPVPEINPATYHLTITDIHNNSKVLTLEDLKKLPQYTVSATIQCAGNRRSEMASVKAVKGLSWGHAAIGNATWTGVKLLDVLKLCEFEDFSHVKHVHFEGLDKGVDGVTYAASVPKALALTAEREVILAFEMNGVPLPRDHGFPVRAIIPGVVGARNVKWLGRIILAEKESDSHWQQNDYKGFSPSVDWDTVDFSKSPAIQELPVISAICSPDNGDVVEVIDDCISVKGYAWSGGGKSIVRLDVSADRGKSWHTADLIDQSGQEDQKHWAWVLWDLLLPIDKNEEEVEIWAKAIDSSYNTQPETFANIWNLRGVLGNAYHKITVKVKR